MAKRRRTVTRTHTSSSSTYKPGFSRGSAAPGGKQMAPPSERDKNRLWWIAGGVAVVATLLVLVYIYALGGAGGASPAPSSLAGGPGGTVGPTVDAALVHPPSATPMASPLAAPAGDGTTATISTDLGDITFELYTESAPVASENFINLANANFYNGTTFHRIVPDFVIQGGDPKGDGTGGPGYTIPDEKVVGQYGRGIVAMARTSAANSAGSQFFIVVADSAEQALAQYNTYVIFGNVTSGMDVVDQIVAGPNSGSPNNAALDPVVMNTVTIQSPPPATPGPSVAPTMAPTASPAPSSSTAPSAPASLPASPAASPSSPGSPKPS